MSSNYKMEYTIGIKADIQQAEKSLKQLSDSINSLMTKQANQGFGSESINAAVESVQTLQLQLNKAINTDTGRLNLHAFNTSLKESGISLKSLSSTLIDAGSEGQKVFIALANTIAQAEVPLKKNKTLLQNFLTDLGKTAKWELSSRLVHSVESVLSGAVSYVKELNSSLTDIRIVTGYSADEMTRFAQQANEAAKKLSTTTKSYADAALIYYQQGDSDDQVSKKAEITIKAANTAFSASAEEMSEMLTAVWNSYQVGEDELENYVDIMAALGAATATSTEEIATAMQKVAATANTVGVSMEQMSSIIATVSSVTREAPESIGTSFKTILARIGDLKLGETLDDGTTLGTVSGTLSQIGVDVLDVNGNLRDMGTILEELMAKWGGLTEAQKTAVAEVVGGKRQYTQLMALLDNQDMYYSNLDIAVNSEGTLEEQQKIWEEGWEAASKRMQASLEELYNKILDDKAIIGFTNALTGVVEIINDIIDGFGGIGGVVATLGALVTKVFSQEITQSLDQTLTKFTTWTSQFSGGKDFISKVVHGKTQTADQINQKNAFGETSGIFSDLESSAEEGSSQQYAIQSAKTLLNIKQNLLAVEGQLNSAQKAGIQAAIDLLSKEQAKIIELKEEKKKLGQFERDQVRKSVNAVYTAGKQVQKTTTTPASGIYIPGANKPQEASTKTEAMYSNDEKINEYVKSQVKDLNSSIDTVEKLYQYINTLANEVGSSSSFLTQTQGVKNDESKEALVNNINNVFGENTVSTSNSLDEIKKKLEEIQQEAQAAQAAIRGVFNEEDTTEEKDGVKTSVTGNADFNKKITEGIDTVFEAGLQQGDLNTIIAGYQERIKKLNEEIKKLSQPVSDVSGKIATGLTKIGQGILNVVAGLNAGKGLVQAFSDESSSLTEKLSGVGSAVTTLANGWSNGIVSGIATTISVVAGGVLGWIEQKEQELKEKIEKDASEAQEVIDDNDSEIANVKSLVKNYNELYVQFKNGEDVQDELRESALELAKAYGSTDAAVLAITGNYEEFNKVIADNLKLTEQQNELKEQADLLQEDYEKTQGGSSVLKATSDAKIQASLELLDENYYITNPESSSETVVKKKSDLANTEDILQAIFQGSDWIDVWDSAADTLREQILKELGYFRNDDGEYFNKEGTKFSYNNAAAFYLDYAEAIDKLVDSWASSKETIEIPSEALVNKKSLANGTKISQAVATGFNLGLLQYDGTDNIVLKGTYEDMDLAQAATTYINATKYLEELQDQVISVDNEAEQTAIDTIIKAIKDQYTSFVTEEQKTLFEKEYAILHQAETLQQLTNQVIPSFLGQTEDSMSREDFVDKWTLLYTDIEENQNLYSDLIGLEGEDLKKAIDKKLADLLKEYTAFGEDYLNTYEVLADTLNTDQQEVLSKYLDDANLNYDDLGSNFITTIVNIFKIKGKKVSEDYLNSVQETLDEAYERDKAFSDLSTWNDIWTGLDTALENLEKGTEDGITAFADFLEQYWDEIKEFYGDQEYEDVLSDFISSDEPTQKKMKNELGLEISKKKNQALNVYDDTESFRQAQREAALTAAQDSVDEDSNLGQNLNKSDEQFVNRTYGEDVVIAAERLFDYVDSAFKKEESGKYVFDEEHQYDTIEEAIDALLDTENNDWVESLNDNWLSGFKLWLEGGNAELLNSLITLFNLSDEDVEKERLIQNQLQENQTQSNIIGVADAKEEEIEQNYRLDDRIAATESAIATKWDDLDSSAQASLIQLGYGKDTDYKATYKALLGQAVNADKVELSKFELSAEDQGYQLKEDNRWYKDGELATELNEDWESRMSDYIEDVNKFMQANREIQEASWEEYGLDVDEVDALGDSIQELAETSEDFADSLKDNGDVADEVAKDIKRYGKAVESVTDNYDDWMDALNSGHLEKQAAAMEELDEAYADMLDLDYDQLSNSFLSNTENLKLMKEAANGSEEAYNSLRDAAAQDLMIQYGLDDTQINELNNIIASANLDDLEVGAEIETEGFLQSLNEMIAAAGLTTDQVTSLLSAMGIDATVVEGKTSDEVEHIQDLEATPNVQYTPIGLPFLGSYDMPYSTIDYELVDQTVTIPGKTVSAVEVTSATKSAGGNIKHKNASSTAPKKSSGGGGGGGGGGSSKKADKKKPEDEIERYHYVNKNLDRLADLLDEIDKKKASVYGKGYLDYLNQEIALTKQECEVYQDYIDEAKEYLALDSERMISLGATFDAFGNISNYEEVMNGILDQYNAFIDKYNAGKADDDAKEEWDEWYEEKTKWIENYEETIDTLYEQQNNLLEAQNKISENTLSAIQYKIEIHVDFSDAEKEFLEYLNDKYEDILEMQGQAMDNLVQETSIAIENLAALGEEKSELDAAFEEGTLNQADYISGLQELNDNILNNLDSIEEYKEKIEEFYKEALQLVSEELDKQTAKIQSASDAMKSYIAILQLVGRGSNFEQLSKFYESQYEYNLAQLKTQKEYQNILKEEERYYLERLESEEGLTELEREQYEALEEEINNVNKDILSNTEAALNQIVDAYNNDIELIFDKLNEEIAGVGNSIEGLADAYSYYQEEQERYVSSAKELYEVNKLNRKIEDSINDTTSKVNKDLLAALKERINRQSELNELTEYDINMNELQYELLLKKIALEEAQNAKSTVRLTRDSGGNYVYQYTANQDDLDQKQQEYEDVLQQINELAVDRTSSLESQLLEIYQNTLDNIKEIAQDTTLTEQEKYDKIQELMSQFKDQTTYIQEQYQNVSSSLITSNLTIAEYYGQALVEHSEEAQNGMNKTISAMIEDTSNLQTKLEEACTVAIPEAMSTMQQRIDEVKDAVNLDYSTMSDSIKTYNEVTQDAQEESSKIASTLNEEVLPAIHSISSAWDSYTQTLKTVINTYESMYQAILKTISAQAQLSRATASSTVTVSGGGTVTPGTTSTPTITNSNSSGSGNSGGNGGGGGKTPTYKGGTQYLTVTYKKRITTGIGKGSTSIGPTPTGATRIAVGTRGTWSHNITSDKFGKGGFIVSGDTASASVTATTITALAAGSITITAKYWDKRTPAEVAAYKEKEQKLEYSEYATGGLADFTGPAWLDGSPSKPEIVLNPKDTENLLTAVKGIRALDSTTMGALNRYITNASLAMSFGLSGISAGSVYGNNSGIQQQVHITAEFPNATSSTEIQNAFDNLINRAAQYVSTK